MRVRASARQIETGGMPPRAEFHSSTLRRLARIVCGVHTRPEIMALLDRARIDPAKRGGASKEKILRGVFRRLQKGRDYETAIKVLEVACDPRGRSNKRGITEEINQSLRRHNLAIGEDHRAVDIDRGQPHTHTGGLEFDLRGYHPLVVRHARSKFIKKEYTGAVAESCKMLEDLVQRRSGRDGYGVDLMAEALGTGYLEVGRTLKPKTRQSVQRGLMFMCMGIMSSVRNPASHVFEAKLAISKADALDILGTISYLSRQIEAARRGAGPAPEGGARGGSVARAAGHARVPAGRPAARARRAPEITMTVEPPVVTPGGTVNVTATGRGIGGWYVGVSSEGRKPVSAPTLLEAHGPPRRAGGRATYEFPVMTHGYAYGVYRVSVSEGRGMDSRGMRVRAFTVAAEQPADDEQYQLMVHGCL